MLHVHTNYDVFTQIHIVYHEKMFKDIYFNFHIVYNKNIVGSSAVSPTVKKKEWQWNLHVRCSWTTFTWSTKVVSYIHVLLNYLVYR